MCFVEPFSDDNACEIVAMCNSIVKECHRTLEFLTAAGNHSTDKSAGERNGTTGLESSHQALVEETAEHSSRKFILCILPSTISGDISCDMLARFTSNIKDTCGRLEVLVMQKLITSEPSSGAAISSCSALKYKERDESIIV